MAERTISEQAQDLDLGAMRTEMTERAQQAMSQAADFAREKPHLAVGIALGVGWVLGNGIPPRLVMTAARLGWKAMLGGALAGSGIAGILREATGVDLPVGGSRGDGGGTARGSKESSPRVRAASPAPKD